jgi:transposase
MIDKLISPEHFLRKILSLIDFKFVDTETESLFSPNRGRESVPPQQYFKMMLIKHLYGISSIRQLVENIQYNIAYRWFCGFTIEDKIPDQSFFSKMKKRLGANYFERFFNAILQQCIDKGLVKSESVMTDSTLFNANASFDSMLRIDGKKRVPGKEKFSNKTHKSITDPDATLAFKAGTTRSLKYKAHVCSDTESRVIINLKVTTGAVHDSVPFIEQIEDIRHYGLKVNEAIADSAYGSADILTELSRRSISSNIPLFSSRSGSEKSANKLDGFAYNTQKDEFICPNGKSLKSTNTKADNVLYISKSKDCTSCPLASGCAAKVRNKSGSRVVSRNRNAELFKQIREKMERDEFKQKMYQRMWKLEGIMNELKNCNGLGRANYRGLDNVRVQGYMAAIAINIKRIVYFWLYKTMLELILF